MPVKLATALFLSLVFAIAPATAPGRTIEPAPLWGALRPGPFAVGFRVIHAQDPSRTWSPSADGRPRAAAGPSARPVRLLVWYPARARARASRLTFGAYTGLPTSPLGGADAYRQLDLRATAELRRFVGSDRAFEALVATPTAATHAPEPAPGRFPLVAYSAGLNESFEAANFVLSEYLASYGYVVITVPQLGTDGASTSLAVSPADLETQTRDVEFAIGTMAAAAYVDRTRVATAGHSMGGVVALLVAMRRSDVGAAVGLDGTYGFAGSSETLTRSSSYDPRRLRAALLDLRRAGAPLDLGALDALRYSDRTFVELPDMRHGDFTSFPAIRARFASPPASGDRWAAPGRGYRAVCEYVRNFLDASLKHSDDARALLARTPAENGLGPVGVRYRRAPGLEPPPSETQFVAIIRASGASSALETYRRFREREPNVEIVREGVLNQIGYEALGDGRAAEAVEVFAFNAATHPDSANAYDSLADGYLGAGDTAGAVRAYERVLEVLPRDTTSSEQNKTALRENATEQLKRLRAAR